MIYGVNLGVSSTHGDVLESYEATEAAVRMASLDTESGDDISHRDYWTWSGIFHEIATYPATWIST